MVNFWDKAEEVIKLRPGSARRFRTAVKELLIDCFNCVVRCLEGPDIVWDADDGINELHSQRIIEALRRANENQNTAGKPQDGKDPKHKLTTGANL